MNPRLHKNLFTGKCGLDRPTTVETSIAIRCLLKRTSKAEYERAVKRMKESRKSGNRLSNSCSKSEKMFAYAISPVRMG